MIHLKYCAVFKPLRIFAVRERVGNKVIWWQVSVENVKMPLWVEKTSCKELEMLFSLYLTFLSSSDESTHIAGRCVYRGRPPGSKDGFVGGGLLGIWNSWWKFQGSSHPQRAGATIASSSSILRVIGTSEWYHCHTCVSPHDRPGTSWSFDNSN